MAIFFATMGTAPSDVKAENKKTAFIDLDDGDTRGVTAGDRVNVHIVHREGFMLRSFPARVAKVLGAVGKRGAPTLRWWVQFENTGGNDD